MKKLFSLLLMVLISISLFSGVAPSSKRLGKVAVSLDEDSLSLLAYKAFSSPLSEQWLREHTIATEAFIVSYLPFLSEILPMENIIISEEKENRLSLYSRKSGYLISLIYENGLISAMSFKPI